MYQRERQALDGSPIETLYQQHAPALLRDIHRSIFSPEDADDILVEVFLAAIENPTLFRRSLEEQLAWLKRVARNKVVDYQRSVIRAPAVALDRMYGSPFDTDPLTPEIALVEQEDAELLRAHLSTLPQLQQQVLRLRFGEGLRTKEIALRLHKSDAAIRSLLLRSLNLLRNIYNRHGEERMYE
jgi:RNA polymerase sigma-70 factor (ECF subfamily)